MKTEELIDYRILDAAIAKWGCNTQCEMAVEECTELSLALQKLKRLGGDRNEKLFNVIDEIADVKIMIHQLERIFDNSAINERVKFKMNRLNDRINDGEC